MPSVKAQVAGEEATVSYIIPTVRPTPAIGVMYPQKMDRPSGTGYVKYEDLYRPGDDLRAVVAKVQGAILTLPEGEFTVKGFDDPKGYYEGCRFGANIKGVIGSGKNTILRVAQNSTTRTKEVDATNTPGNAGKKIAGIQFQANGSPGFQAANFQVAGYEQGGHYYGGLGLVRSPGAKAWNLWLRGASRGYSSYPPGETFGINVYLSDDTTLQDIDIDGRDDAGNRVGASSFGWNGSANNDRSASCKRARVIRVNCHEGVAGMPTFWKTEDIYTEDLISHGNSTGTSAAGISGSGINHEQCWGRIEHLRPWLYPNGSGDLKTGSTGANFGHNSNLWNPSLGDVFIMRDPKWGAPNNGSMAITMSARDGYALGNKVTRAVQDSVQVYLGDTLLKWRHHPEAGWSKGNPLTEAAWIH